VRSWYKECLDPTDALGCIAKEIARLVLAPDQQCFLEVFFPHLEDRSCRISHSLVMHLARALAQGVSPSVLYEASVGACQPEVRQARGLVYTPDAVATFVLDKVSLSETGDVVDPACGTGVFLTSILSRAAVERREEMLERLYGFDIDRDALGLARALLFALSGSREPRVVKGLCERITERDITLSLLPEWESRWCLVVGNPPFVSPLRRTTVVPAFHSVDPYHGLGVPTTDLSSVFVYRAAQMCQSGGSVALVLPRSFPASKGAERVRGALDAGGKTVEIVPVGGGAFKVGAHPVVLHYRRGDGSLDGSRERTVNWGFWLASAPKIPTIPSEVLGRVASFRAGHRDEYYEIVSAVCEYGTGTDFVKVITVGMVGLNSSRWGKGVVRIARRHFSAPVVSPTMLKARFHVEQLGAKVLIPPQKRVLMPLVDEMGNSVGLTPMIAAIPRGDSDIEPSQLASAIASPVSSALIETSCAGLGLSPHVLRFRAADLASLPLPIDYGAWERGTALYGALDGTDSNAVREFGEVMGGAYGLSDQCAQEVVDWWLGRIR